MRRKKLSLLLFILVVVFAFGLTACNLWNGDKNVVASVEKTEDTMVVIKVEKAEAGATLVDAMEYLQKENALTYTLDGAGMVSGINGKENSANWSDCWMLYTSDAEFSNTQWGTCEYEGSILGSAILGAEALPVQDGGIYVWVYKAFN